MLCECGCGRETRTATRTYEPETAGGLLLQNRTRTAEHATSCRISLTQFFCANLKAEAMKLKASECCAECGDAAPRVRKGKRFTLCEDCRAAVTTRRWRVRKAMRSLRNEIGHVVEYNEGEGWRTGYLVEILSVNGRVQPIGACGRVPDIVTVCLADVKTPTCGSPSMPTVEDFYRRMESMKPKKVVVLVAQPVVVKCTAGANKGLSAVAAQTDELAGPETGDVSFPYGANAPAPVFVGLDLATKSADSSTVKKSHTVHSRRKDAATFAARYASTTTFQKHRLRLSGQASCWRSDSLEETEHTGSVNVSGETKVMYAAELRAATMSSVGLFSAVEIANISGGRRPPAPKGYKLPSVFPSFDRSKRVSIDLESLDPSIAASIGPGWRRDAYIVGFGIALGDKKGSNEFHEYYPIRHKGVENLDAERVLDWLATELAFYRGEIVGTNLLYDFDGFQYQRIHAPFAKFRDIQWAEALLDENAFSYGLNTLSKKYGGEGKVNDVLKQMYGDHYIERFHEIHPGHARAYGLGDVDEPLRILPQQEKQLRKENLDELFDLESRLLPFLLYMRQQGTRVDLKKAARMNIELAATRDKTIREIAEMSGVDTDYENFGKPQIMKAIFDRLDIRYPYLLPKKSDGKEGEIVNPPDEKSSAEHIQKYEQAKIDGKPSFRKLWLDQVLDHPISDLILKANGAEKARGTFVDGYITDNAIGDRVYCEFHPLRRKKDENTKSQGTITGRFSCAAGWTTVHTPSGDVQLSSISVGDFVWTHKNRWRPVTHTWMKGLEQMFSITLENGYVLTCTGDHLVLEFSNEHFEEVDFSGRECNSGSTSVSLDGIVDDRAGSLPPKHNLPHSRLHSKNTPSSSRTQGTRGTSLFSEQRGFQESDDRENRGGTPQLARNCERWVRVRDLYKRWQETVRPSNCHGGGAWLAGASGDFRCSPHRQEHGEQRTGQSCSSDARRPQDDSFPSSEGHRHVAIKEINPSGMFAVYDITVAEDESYCSNGIFSHNSSNPNLQNIPARDDIIGPMCRSMFLPDDGCDFFSADYSQIEYRFLVHYGVEYKCTGADVPQRMYQMNPLTDFHDACAMMMYKKDWDEATAAFLAGRISEKEMVSIHKKLRKPAKNLNFGMVYGMGAPLLAAQLGETNSDGSPNEKANGIMKDYHAAAPYIRELNKICVSEAEKQEFITTILKRRGRFHLWEPRYKEKGKEYGKPCSHEEALAQWGNKIHLCGTHTAPPCRRGRLRAAGGAHVRHDPLGGRRRVTGEHHVHAGLRVDGRSAEPSTEAADGPAAPASVFGANTRSRPVAPGAGGGRQGRGRAHRGRTCAPAGSPPRRRRWCLS